MRIEPPIELEARLMPTYVVPAIRPLLEISPVMVLELAEIPVLPPRIVPVPALRIEPPMELEARLMPTYAVPLIRPLLEILPAMPLELA